MTGRYDLTTLTAAEEECLRRSYLDLWSLASCEVPSVRCAARAALAHVAQALNGEGLAYELYTASLPE